jgi:hypothetical protein
MKRYRNINTGAVVETNSALFTGKGSQWELVSKSEEPKVAPAPKAEEPKVAPAATLKVAPAAKTTK